MQLCELTQSGRIFFEQIKNYIQKGQGYKQIRHHLLKQLNQMNSQNHNSDDALIPAIVQKLRKQIISEKNQNVARSIDIIEDLLQYAFDVMQPYFCTQSFCLSLSIAISYKKLFSLSKALFDDNKIRLGSIVIFYYQKLQSDTNRYAHILKIYKQLNEKNCVFPTQTFIKIPKQNQFKKVVKINTEKNQENNIALINFQAILQFVKQTQQKFNKNKMSCANTQFVRALKVKAKILFDMSQNSNEISLKPQQKQQAKIMYKKIRTILKQIQKINQSKIKNQKIKSEKQFAQQKIQQLTPNKKKQLDISSQNLSSNKNIDSKKTKNIDLLNQPQIKSPNIQKPASLLDDQPIDISNYINSGLLDRTQNIQSPKKSIKLLPKPPKYEDLLGNSPIKSNNITSNFQNKINKEQNDQLLIDTTNQPLDFSRKSINSINSQQSNNAIRNQMNQNNVKSVKQLSQKQIITNQMGLQFNNEQLFSRFEIINQFKDLNNYNQLLNDIDFSDKSSQSRNQGQKFTFQNENDNQFFDGESNKNYDKHLTPKKLYSFVQKNQKNISRQLNQKLALSANYKEKKVEQLIPNYNFGILADNRQVQAYNYDNFKPKYNSGDRSSIGTQQDEQKIIRLTPNSKTSKNQIRSVQQLSQSILTFNEDGNIKNNKIILTGKDQDQEDQFQEFQKGQSLLEEQPKIIYSQMEYKQKFSNLSSEKQKQLQNICSIQSPNKFLI